MNFSDVIPIWMLQGSIKKLTTVGKDVVSMHGGCFILFFNFKKNDTLFYSATPCGNGRGEGVKKMIGHKLINVFAFCEACSYPNIHVLSYPDFSVYCSIETDNVDGIHNMTFNNSTSLITLSTEPTHRINIYNYLTGEKLISVKSDIFSPMQKIRVNDAVAESMFQLGTDTHQIRIWDLFAVNKGSTVQCHKLYSLENPPYYVDAIWGTDNQLYVCDQEGSVYQVSPRNYLVKIWSGEYLLSKNLFKISKIGPLLVLYGTDNRIISYKKVDGQLVEEWRVELNGDVRDLTSNNAQLAFLTEAEGMVFLDEQGERLPVSYNPPTNFGNLSMVLPTGEYITMTGRYKFLYVYRVFDGEMVALYELRQKPLTVKGNPEFPYVAVGYDDGLLELVSIYTPEKPTQLTIFQLTRNPIQSIYFGAYGKVFVAACKDIGEFFILEGFPGSTIKIIACVQAKVQVVDYMIVGSKPCYRLFLIPITSRTRLGGYKIVRYCILGKENMNRKDYFFADKTVLYNRIVASLKPNRDRVFYMVPMRSKYIHEVETKRGKMDIEIISKIPSGHQLSNFGLRINTTHAITYGYDGFIIIRDQKLQKEIAISHVHHRRYFGVRYAFVDHLSQYIISIGHDNVVVCSKIQNQVVNLKKQAEYLNTMQSPVFQSIFSRPTKGFLPKGSFEGMSWLELEAYKKSKEEGLICKPTRQKMLKDLEKIKVTMRQLITENLEGPENHQLELTEFNLDIKGYKEACKRNEEECEAKAKYYRQLIEAQDRVYHYIKENFFDKMQVMEKVMHGIFKNDLVSNYSLDFVNIEKKEEIDGYLELAKMENYYSSLNKFHPWIPHSDSRIVAVLSAAPKLETELDDLDIDLRDTSLSNDTKIFIDGTMTNLFIDKVITNQIEVTTFFKIFIQDLKMKRNVRQLKEVFNQKFDTLFDTKQRRVQLLKEKNERQRKIISEINYFSESKIYMDIEDPPWHLYENPPQILQVLDHEMTVTPYISPSEQAILDAKAAEAERLRLLLLADDFRERALMAMMNGVLEIRWEDELKKDVPLPKCMVEKDPMNFNEDDLRAVKEYEDKVTFLHSERERYKGLLDKEFTKNCLHIKEMIKKFNTELVDLNSLKMNIEAAIIQEQLMLNTKRLHQVKRLELVEEEAKMKKRIVETEEQIEIVIKLSRQFEDILKDYKAKNENVIIKDKLIDRTFRRELTEQTPIVVDLALKVYKRRPKASYKQIINPQILQELSKCVLTGEKSVKLNEEAIEYLKSLDILDQPIGLPPQIDDHLFFVICKHRRLKLELEIKMRAITTEVNNLDSLITMYQKRLAIKKEVLSELQTRLDNIHGEILLQGYNPLVQVVMRNGYIHLNMKGNFSDFDNALLVPKDNIIEINRYILNAGNEKLATMERNMEFHRSVMENEWKHLRKRMLINDLNEQLNDIKDVKVTKEVHEYLKHKRKGTTPKINTFELEIEQQKNSWLSQLKEMKSEESMFKKQINQMIEKNEALDQEIHATNIQINTHRTQLIPDVTEKNSKIMNARIRNILKRGSLIQEMQKNHAEILMLQTELELLRLKTYPTFQYKMLNK